MPTGGGASSSRPATALAYDAEKSLREHGDKVGADVRREIETAVADLKRARDGEDMNAMQRASENLSTVMAKMGEQIYRAAGAGSSAAGPGGAGPGAGGAGKPGAEQGTVDAEYEVVDDDKDRK